VGIDGNKGADEFAKTVIEEASRALAKSTAACERRASARRDYPIMAFDLKTASKSSSSDGGNSEYEGGGRK
jgi:hypothetical protein